MMSRIFAPRGGLLLCGVLLTGCSASAPNQAPLQTVAHVNLNRYLGTWYEIAKIPNRFQKQCMGDTTAHYARRADGRIDVVNRCRTKHGRYDEARGVARVIDTQSNAKLEVSFVSLLGWHLFWGDYWIIGLGNDYRYAVVGTPNRKYGWILSRTPLLATTDRSRVDALLERSGYNPAAFEPTAQTAMHSR